MEVWYSYITGVFKVIKRKISIKTVFGHNKKLTAVQQKKKSLPEKIEKKKINFVKYLWQINKYKSLYENM